MNVRVDQRHSSTTLCPHYPVNPGSVAWCGASSIPRHRHEEAYAALVLAGGYEETGTRGRYRVRPGQVLLHRMFDAHLDRFETSGARILNLLLAEEPEFALGCVADPDAIARLAERDATAAAGVLREQLRPLAPPVSDWPDALARDLLDDPHLQLGHWAARNRLAPETVSRGFRKVFATSPVAFRAEARAHSALARIVRGTGPLAEVAVGAGFADQSHMTRAVTGLTGRPPGHWLKVKSVQDAAGVC